MLVPLTSRRDPVLASVIGKGNIQIPIPVLRDLAADRFKCARALTVACFRQRACLLVWRASQQAMNKFYLLVPQRWSLAPLLWRLVNR